MEQEQKKFSYTDEIDASTEELQSQADQPSPEEVQASREYLFTLGINPDERELTPAQAVAKAQHLQEVGVKAAQVLSRGQTLDGIEKLLKSLPSDRVGQLVQDDPLQIERYKALGFRVEKRNSGDGAGIHDSADGVLRLGDCILMSVDRDVYSVIEQGRQRARQPKVALGRNKFRMDNKGHGVPTIDTTTKDGA